MNCGIIKKEMGKIEESLACYQECLELQQEKLGKTHPDIFFNYMNMGMLYADSLLDYEKAEEFYRMGLKGFERSLGSHECAVKAANQLVCLMEKIGRLEQARADFGAKYPMIFTRSKSKEHSFTITESYS